MTAFDFRPIRRSGLSARRRLLSRAQAGEQRRRAEVDATGAVRVIGVLLPANRQTLLDGALSRFGL
jgi:hypothetical protein